MKWLFLSKFHPVVAVTEKTRLQRRRTEETLSVAGENSDSSTVNMFEGLCRLSPLYTFVFLFRVIQREETFFRHQDAHRYQRVSCQIHTHNY